MIDQRNEAPARQARHHGAEHRHRGEHDEKVAVNSHCRLRTPPAMPISSRSGRST